jgi:hypothetical protein
VTLTGANVHDKHMYGKTLDAVVLKGSRGPRRPKNLCLDKGYDYKQPEQEARARGVKPHIRRQGEPALTGPIRGKKPRRWGGRTHEQLAQQLPSTTDGRESRIITWDLFTSPALSSRFRR